MHEAERSGFNAQEVILEQLRADFRNKHRECEKAAHALACELPVGDERTIAFEQYEIIRTAPRVARIGN